MKSLISVNMKFMDVKPSRLVELINNSKYTKGLEIYVNVNNENEVKYLDELVYELKKYNLILQVHGESCLELDKQFEYLKKLENYSDMLNDKIVVTMHSLYDEDKDISLKKTADYLNTVIDNIDNNKLVICLENLNDMDGKDRLEKEYIRPAVLNNEKLFFTYDMGHEIIDYGNLTNLDKYMIEEIRNVHLHTHNDKGKDHMPIYKNCKHWDSIIKCITYLRLNNYQYNIVYEYDLTECYGETTEEKIIDYLNSIDFVSEHYSI